ncbi:crossover junction endodeoxyribonuclease RuvC [Nisaea acidiphila]|uniref:Crossover junction endodeoxyribonuclease RuvC n=1 Tax=Nisaea acidiphila TaxID=1862145 RepID=A0A9J7AQ92_9PROT|nr:crossover junction endodeoxyribonuclease RuvC [Nisaea acidiphila]UUX48769.1 crossover junction endodeoxyribonuclease RuvC [Nisaea acidiphila]
MRLLGLDPGLRFTGWGVIDVDGNRLRHVANGTLRSTASRSIAERLLELHDGVLEIIETHRPDEAAVEETFVNKNPESTLKLGLARGAVLLAPAKKGMRVTEYAPNRVKKTVVGAGHANKDQIQVMVNKLLPDAAFESPDAADALAVAVCHAHFAQSRHAFGDKVGVSRIRKQSATGGYEKAVQAALRKEMGL